MFAETVNADELQSKRTTCLHRCTSVLSDDSELSTLCDEEPLTKGEMGFCAEKEQTGPELLSSSEDSSPESDLPFSKKFLNVFVNSTTRSSSKSVGKRANIHTLHSKQIRVILLSGTRNKALICTL